MNTLKYFTIIALTGVFCAKEAFAYEVSNYRFNSSIKNEIYQAAEKKNINRLQQILSLGYSIDIADEYGMSAICTAREMGNDEAFDILYKYGADNKAPCMKKAEELARKHAWTKTIKYGGLTAIGAGVVGALALSSGGGGGGGDGDGGSGGGTSNYVPGSNGTVASGDWTQAATAVLDNAALSTAYDEDYFNNNDEFKNKFAVDDAEVSGVNYLGGINAAKAFAGHYGVDANGNFTSNLSEVNVGVLDSGVWGNHDEFKTSNGTKVNGYNFDYGPCLNGDTSNCWKIADTQEYLSNGMLIVSLLDNDGKVKRNSVMACESGSAENCYNFWAAEYPENYDWDNLQYYYYPNNHNSTFGDGSLHGTHVAGIIAANADGNGNMGVAPANTKITAARYDMMSSIKDPLLKLNSDKVLAVNMSIGLESTQDNNASHATDDEKLVASLGEDQLEAYKEIIKSYTKDETKGLDGMILVKAAGNDKQQANPDIMSGVKLNDNYKDLLTLVVVSVDVTMDGNTVSDYKLSSYSNKCGATAAFCIAAPGGTGSNDIYSVGAPSDGYIGMSGTSMATPVVTGAIAFIKGAYPYMTSSQIIELLTTTANAKSGEESTYGVGLLDLGKATTYQASVSTGGFSTVSGESFSSERLNVSAAHINVPSTFKSALSKALPKKITVFDKYDRPFAISTEGMVSTTHGGYKTLKNDVYQISQRSEIKKVQQGNLNFAFTGSAANSNGSGLGFMTADYQTEKYTAGFYFSENTRYEGGEYFADATSNPFMAMQNAYGIHNTFNLNKNMGLKIEAVTGRNGLYDGESSLYDASFKKQAYAMNSELQLHKGENFGFSLTSGLLYENGATLGMNGNGIFKANDTGTYNAGVKASWYATDKLTFTGSYYRGYTEGQSFDSNLLQTSDLVSESFAFDANYKLNKQTSFGFNLSSPLRVINGKLSVNFPSGRDNYSETVYFDRYTAALKPEAREYKFALYANHNFSERLSLRSELDVRVNPEHQRQENDYRALFGLNWNFN
mgnify:FL=1